MNLTVLNTLRRFVIPNRKVAITQPELRTNRYPKPSHNPHLPVCAAFIQEGLMRDGHAAYERLLHHWGQGCVELVSVATGYASLAASIVEQACREDLEFPGVYVYEVCSPFGDWFARYVETHGTCPDTVEALHKLVTLAREFFLQSTSGLSAVEEATFVLALDMILEEALPPPYRLTLRQQLGFSQEVVL